MLFFHNLSIYVLVCIYAGVWRQIGRRCSSFRVLRLFCLNAVWITMLLGSLCARFRDIQQLVGTLLQISLFLTPIFWSPDQLTGRTAMLAQFNPMYHLIAVVRDPMLGKAPETVALACCRSHSDLSDGRLTFQMLTKFRPRIVYWL